MKHQKTGWLMALLCAVGVVLLTFGRHSLADSPEGPTGHVQQGLVGGTTIDAATQEKFALLTLRGNGGVCSASLLRNNWAVTAAHCVEVENADGSFTADPNRPGQNMIQPLAGMTLAADWKTPQTQKVVQVNTFRPYDVAIVRVAEPFNLNGSTTGFSQLIFQDGQFPYFGEPVGADLILFGRGISQFATGSGATAMPSVRDGLYRIGYAKATYNKDNRFWYPSENGQMIAGGDSGGPSFAWTLSGYALVGVHSLTHATYVPGQPTEGWDWVTSTPEAADAPLAPVLDEMNTFMGALPPSQNAYPPPNNFIGKFAQTAQNYGAMFIYGIQPNGDLMWYRKDSNAPAWQGPKKVGVGWNGPKDVIAAGGNRFYALTQDGQLSWYQHDGFNDGSFQWKGPVVAGTGWTFKRIFSGGDGVVYAIRSDGKLFWSHHLAYQTGAPNWEAAKEVGSGWGDFKDVFSQGKGQVFAVKPDGTLLLYQQIGWETGEKSWYPARVVGSAWNQFQQLVPAGDGVILAVRPDGALIRYRYLGLKSPVAFGRLKDTWEKETNIGSGWNGFAKVFALVPSAPDVVR